MVGLVLYTVICSRSFLIRLNQYRDRCLSVLFPHTPGLSSLPQSLAVLFSVFKTLPVVGTAASWDFGVGHAGICLELYSSVAM